jgi:hypothetical protein
MKLVEGSAPQAWERDSSYSWGAAVMNTDPYNDDDDSPTLQRPPTGSVQIRRVAFVEESSTDTDLVPLDALAPPESLADAHTVDSLPPDEALALLDIEVTHVPDYTDMETPKIPLDVAAVLLRASQEDDD